jgi:catechol 2,3-dioxygenase-like lactoylglutathione lyase family enzyme
VHLDHINIRASKELVEDVRAFYCAVLGFETGPRPAFSSPGYWLYYEGRPLVHLSVDPDGATGGGSSHLDHIAFRAEGPERFRTRLEANGISYRCSRVPEVGLTQLFLRDPAGNGLEINFADR